MYSMAAFGPVIGFLLGAYLLSFHMDWMSGSVINIGETLNLNFNLKPNHVINFCPLVSDPTDRRWVGMWWGGFLLCGLLLIIVAIPFFSFPKVSPTEDERGRSIFFY